MFHKTNADIKPACFTEKQREGKINMKERKTKGYRSIAGLEKLTKEEIKARNLETYGSKIKHYRIKAGLEAAGEDAAEVAKRLRRKINDYNAFCRENRLTPQMDRTFIA